MKKNYLQKEENQITKIQKSQIEVPHLDTEEVHHLAGNKNIDIKFNVHDTFLE